MTFRGNEKVLTDSSLSDVEKFYEVAEHNAPLLRKICQKFVGKTPVLDIDDLEQEARIFLLVRVIPLYDKERGMFTTFLSTSLTRHLRDLVRKFPAFRALKGAINEAYTRDVDDILREIEDDMGPQYMKLLRMKVKGRNLRQIGKDFKVSHETARTLVNAMRRKVKECI